MLKWHGRNTAAGSTFLNKIAQQPPTELRIWVCLWTRLKLHPFFWDKNKNVYVISSKLHAKESVQERIMQSNCHCHILISVTTTKEVELNPELWPLVRLYLQRNEDLDLMNAYFGYTVRVESH